MESDVEEDKQIEGSNKMSSATDVQLLLLERNLAPLPGNVYRVCVFRAARTLLVGVGQKLGKRAFHHKKGKIKTCSILFGKRWKYTIYTTSLPTILVGF